MACELVPWQPYMAGAVLEPLECTPDLDEMTYEDERNRLSVFYLPTGGSRRLRKISTFDKVFLNRRITDYCQNVHLLAIFGRPNLDINISCPGIAQPFYSRLRLTLHLGLLDVHAYKTKKKRGPKHRWAEDKVAQVIANTVLQTSQTIFHQLNIASYQWQFGRRDTRFMSMMSREPYVWAQWHVSAFLLLELITYINYISLAR
jgi:hypothetical protein